MANIERTTNKKGETVYKVQVSNGRGNRIKRSWKPAPGWSARTIERELNKFAADLERQLKEGDVVTRKDAVIQKAAAAAEAAKLKTFKQYCEGVFMAEIRVSGAENTRANYQRMLDKHLYPVFGDFLMTDITPAMISSFLTNFQGSSYTPVHGQMKKTGPDGKIQEPKRIRRKEEAPEEKKYAYSTVIKAYTILNTVFSAAFRDDVIPVSPMLKVKRPSPRKDEEIKAPEDEEYTADVLKYVLECMEKEPIKWRAYVNVTADTGARRGEISGLQWEDIDFENSKATFQRNLQYTSDKGVYIDTNKNRKKRTIDLGADTIELLRQLRMEQAKKCISKWVFTREGSPEPLHPDTPTGYFKKIGERYGIEDFHPHKLRHTSASIAVTNGADIRSVADRLGHGDPSFTLKRYTHSNEESVRAAGQVVRDAVEVATAKK